MAVEIRAPFDHTQDIDDFRGVSRKPQRLPEVVVIALADMDTQWFEGFCQLLKNGVDGVTQITAVLKIQPKRKERRLPLERLKKG